MKISFEETVKGTIYITTMVLTCMAIVPGLMVDLKNNICEALILGIFAALFLAWVDNIQD